MEKILIIEDDEGILEALELTLENEGYTAITSQDYDVIERNLSQIKPDLVIMDIFLSGRDGRDLCQKIKSDPNFRNIPVMLISAATNMEKSAQAAGADAFLSKPFTLNQLTYTVRVLLKN